MITHIEYKKWLIESKGTDLKALQRGDVIGFVYNADSKLEGRKPTILFPLVMIAEMRPLGIWGYNLFESQSPQVAETIIESIKGMQKSDSTPDYSLRMELAKKLHATQTTRSAYREFFFKRIIPNSIVKLSMIDINNLI